jgi:hypothetical protein
VITTATTPWTEVISTGGGDLIRDRENAREVAKLLDRWARKTFPELEAARRNARRAFERFRETAPSGVIELAADVLALRQH